MNGSSYTPVAARPVGLIRDSSLGSAHSAWLALFDSVPSTMSVPVPQESNSLASTITPLPAP